MNKNQPHPPFCPTALSSCLTHKLILSKSTEFSTSSIQPSNSTIPGPPDPSTWALAGQIPSGAVGLRPGQGTRKVAGGPGDPHWCPLLGPAEGREAPSPVSLIGFGLHGNPRAGGLWQGEGRRPRPADQWEPPSSAAAKPEWQPWRLTIVPPSAAAPRSGRGAPRRGALGIPGCPPRSLAAYSPAPPGLPGPVSHANADLGPNKRRGR